MTNRKMSRLILLLAAFVAACASGAKRKAAAASSIGGARPDWVDSESQEWPRTRFIVGVGSADDEGPAAERARGEVARVFSADVSVNSSSDQSEISQNQNGKTATSFSSSVSEQVHTATKKALEGVDIVARWKDASAGSRYYALAALPKDQALLAITEKVSEIDAEAAQYNAQLKAAADPFARAKAAAKLLTLAKVMPGLQADSRVLGGGPLNADFDVAAARADAAKALAALDVAVSVTGDGADAVLTGAVAGLNAAGLSAKQGAPADKSDLSATVQTTVAPADTSDARWQRTRASAAVTLLDGRAGKAFSSFNVSVREDSVDAGESRRRALDSLAKKTAEQVTAAINDFFANQ